MLSCILSKFYIKPQHRANALRFGGGCILSKFYIKPQPRVDHGRDGSVVSYRNSTSNHNSLVLQVSPPSLYLIEILHQTTTNSRLPLPLKGCILSKFYIKPQLCPRYWCLDVVVSYRNSTSNHNYRPNFPKVGRVVSYRNSTSNHNADTREKNLRQLYLIEILHQTTTRFCILFPIYRCILSKFYIKPQLGRQRSNFCCVVSYRNSTSNHNMENVDLMF